MFREDGPLVTALGVIVAILITTPIVLFFLISWASWFIPE